MDYPTFLKSIQKHLTAISDNIVNDEERVGNMRAAWSIGAEVYAWQRETGLSAKQIALDAGMIPQTLSKFLRVYRQFPKGLREEIEGFPVTWSHYAALLYERSKEARAFYLREAAVNGWSSHQLRERMRNNYYENRLGEAVKKKGVPRLKVIAQKLYTYGASVKKVIDADTHDLEVDVGFKGRQDHRIRLRGINCAERGTVLGDKAEAFVRERLMPDGPDKPGADIVVRTYKSGKFGRYLVDIWYLPGETNRERILTEGRFLNQELLDNGLAVPAE